MKVITQPTVTVVAHSMFYDHPTYKIPDDGKSMERLGAFAAKGCYDSYGEDGRACEENQRQILEHRHGSVLEHSYATLFIEGITRALTLEMNRHRLMNISQRSTRYTKEEDSAVVLEPFYAELFDRYNLQWNRLDELVMPPQPEVLATESARVEIALIVEFLDSCKSSIHTYKDQVEALIAMNPNGYTGFALRKWARGKARNLLPHALETRVTYSANMRAWRWFIESRSNQHAEPEIRRLADRVLTALRPLAPIYFEDFENAGDWDGIPEWTPAYSKV